MKEQLCELFCGGISVHEVPAGFAVSTAFGRDDGDSVGFYIVPSQTDPELARLEDDGQTIPLLEVSGVDFSGETRGAALAELLSQCGAQIDQDENLIHTDFMPLAKVPKVALRFVELLIRLQDFSLLTKERVESTFRDDVRSEIRAVMPDLNITEREPILPQLKEFEADFVVRDTGHPPLGVFSATPMNEFGTPSSRKWPLTMRQGLLAPSLRCLNGTRRSQRNFAKWRRTELDAVPIFRGEERQSVVRIRQELLKRDLRGGVS